MKYLIEYDNYNLNEKNLMQWIVKSRKFGDLISLRKVTKISKKIAELNYNYDVALSKYQLGNVKMGKSPNAFSIDQANELKSFKEEIILLREKLSLEYGDSEFLTYAAKAIENDEKLRIVRKKRTELQSTMSKKDIKELESVMDEKTDLLKKQMEVASDKPVISLSSIEKSGSDFEKSRRDLMIKDIENRERDIKLKTLKSEYKKKFGKSDDSIFSKTIKDVNTGKYRSSKTSDDDIEIL